MGFPAGPWVPLAAGAQDWRPLFPPPRRTGSGDSRAPPGAALAPKLSWPAAAPTCALMSLGPKSRGAGPASEVGGGQANRVVSQHFVGQNERPVARGFGDGSPLSQCAQNHGAISSLEATLGVQARLPGSARGGLRVLAELCCLSLPDMLLHRYVVSRLIWAYMLSIAMTYFITLCLFPGLESEIHNCTLGEWLPILIMAIFNLSDFVGKVGERPTPARWGGLPPFCVLFQSRLAPPRVISTPWVANQREVAHWHGRG